MTTFAARISENFNNKNKDLYELFSKMKARPSMYIGQGRISTLRAFLDGYFHAMDNCKIANPETPPFYLFNEWTADRFGWYASTAGWHNIILQKNNGDEAKALQIFFELMPEFQQLKPIRIGEITITESNITYYWDESKRIGYYKGKGDEWLRIEPPNRVYVVEFSHNFGFIHYHMKNQKVESIDWRFRSSSESTQRIEAAFGKQIEMNEIEESEVPALFENIIRSAY